MSEKNSKFFILVENANVDEIANAINQDPTIVNAKNEVILLLLI
jgi:hypothetical protein